LVAETSGVGARVEFIVDGQVVGSIAGGGGGWSWIASEIGRHTLEAAAYNADGQRVVSQPVSVLVE
jgi:hypothetical protein